MSQTRVNGKRNAGLGNVASWMACFGLVGLVGCSDLGDPVRVVEEPDPPRDLPVLEELIPARTFVGDSLFVRGTGFGVMPEGRSVRFGSGQIEAELLTWTETEIVVRVPSGDVSGPVQVVDGKRESNDLAFAVAPEVSFEDDLVPVFQMRGCESCHFGESGANGFSVLTPMEIAEGGTRGPGVVSRQPAQSLLARIVRGVDGLPRMPFGADSLPEEEIELIEDWIYQGARNN